MQLNFQSEELETLRLKALEKCSAAFFEAEKVALETSARVMDAFSQCRVQTSHLQGTTGYGYDDAGRDTLDRVMAMAMESEDAILRPHIISGTHALSIALFGLLRPGDILLPVTGKPYDTLDEVIGLRAADGSLAEYGIEYQQIDFTDDGCIDYDAIEVALQQPKVRVVMVQRSKGYQDRVTLSAEQIGTISRFVKEHRPDVYVLVDNCYGEFADAHEPCYYGADLTVGSMIKNPGGGLAKIGGYLAGTKKAVAACEHRLTCPGIGRESGASLNTLQDFYQGLFIAPHTVLQAKKTAIFAAALFELMGFDVKPRYTEERHDIIQGIFLQTPENIKAFCKGIQAGAPIDSFVTPEPWGMPGYEDEVIMAAGTFVSGASIELSADAPMREPYQVFLQGGITFESGMLGVMQAAREIIGK